MCLFPGASHAQFAAVDSRHCLPIPEGYSMETAGGIMEVWLTAFQLLYKVASIKEGDVVFIHAAASGGKYCLLIPSQTCFSWHVTNPTGKAR